ncbi:MAG: hypothetical protein SVM80_00290 [Halobacteriota archaeon]|nr:hypothetical protein [Halobacteriota archaeon]
MTFVDILAIFLIVFGSVGILAVIFGYLSIRRSALFGIVGSLDNFAETADTLNSTVHNASEFLGTSTPIIDGVSRIFFDIGGSLPLVGRSFRELGKSLGTISTNMYTFKESIDDFEEKWSSSIEGIGRVRGGGGLPSIKLIISGVMAWLAALHLILIFIGVAFLLM